MKKSIVVFLLFTFSLFSQDIIYKNDGSEIKSKVIEISSDVIKYKKFSNLDGPLYNLSKAEVFMIVYENGEREVFKSKVENQAVNQNQKVQNQTDVKPPPVVSTSSSSSSYNSTSTDESNLFSLMLKLGYFAPAADVIDQVYGGGLMIGTAPGIWFPSGLGAEIVVNGFFKTGEPLYNTGYQNVETKWTHLLLQFNMLYRIKTNNPTMFPYFGAGVTYAHASEETTGTDRNGQTQSRTASVDGWGFNFCGGFEYEWIFIEVNYTSVKDPDLGGFGAFLGARLYLK